ncbi:hypothetical protein [Marivita sp.]|jgi:hypothetical protein|uniref:hypothetical protein n=1 Tax=Marivita sp. TaxID=2003365 RepID=UPI003F6C3020
MGLTFVVCGADMLKNDPIRKVTIVSQGLDNQCKQGIIRQQEAGSEGWVCASRNRMKPTACTIKVLISYSFGRKKAAAADDPQKPEKAASVKCNEFKTL